MAVSLVQSKVGTNTNDDITLVFDSTPVSGNLLVAVYSQFGVNGLDAMTGWTLIRDVQHSGGSNRIVAWYKIAGASESTSVTAGATGGATSDLAIYEFSGIDATPLDKDNGNDGGYSVTSLQPGTTGTLTQANEVAITAVCTGSSNGGSEAIDSGFTLVGASTLTRSLHGYKIVSATTALNPTLSWATARNCTAIIMTFKASPDTIEIVSQDVATAVTIDNATITQEHNLPVADVAIGVSIDSTTITQTHVITPNDMSVAVSLDTATVVPPQRAQKVDSSVYRNNKPHRIVYRGKIIWLRR